MNAQPITNSTLSSWVCKLPEAIAQKDAHTHIYIRTCVCVLLLGFVIQLLIL